MPRPHALRALPLLRLLRLLRLLLLLLLLLLPAAVLPAPAQEAAAAQDPLARAGALLARGEAQAALRLIEPEVEARLGDRVALPPALRLQGYALVVLRRDREAERVFRALLALVPEDDYAALELAKRLHARAAWDEARERYRWLLRRRPDHPTAAADLDRLEADARAHAKMAARIAEGRRRVWILAGVTLLVLALFGWLTARALRRATSPNS